MKLSVTLLANALASRGQTEDELNTIIDAMLIGGGLVAGLLVAAMLLPPRTAL